MEARVVTFPNRHEAAVRVEPDRIVNLHVDVKDSPDIRNAPGRFPGGLLPASSPAKGCGLR